MSLTIPIEDHHRIVEQLDLAIIGQAAPVELEHLAVAAAALQVVTGEPIVDVRIRNYMAGVTAASQAMVDRLVARVYELEQQLANNG